MQNWNCKNYGGELVAMQWMIEAKGNIRGNIWMPRKGEPISGGRMPFSVFKSTRRGSLYINNISPFPLSLLHLHLPPRHLIFSLPPSKPSHSPPSFFWTLTLISLTMFATAFATAVFALPLLASCKFSHAWVFFLYVANRPFTWRSYSGTCEWLHSPIHREGGRYLW